jgi:hypothetical protein
MERIPINPGFRSQSPLFIAFASLAGIATPKTPRQATAKARKEEGARRG